jgi:hypothetical protein
MKIGVVTSYDSLNYGAFLQAFALQESINRLGHEAEFLNVGTFYHNYQRLKNLLTSIIDNPGFNYKKLKNFKTALKALHVVDESYYKNTKHYDAVVLGSDEIWNLANSSFKHSPIFFGCYINTQNLVSYAASCGNVIKEQIMNNIDALKGLNRIKRLSVRDENTARIIENLTGKKATLVLDPTLLLENYSKYEKETYKPGYILVYTYLFRDWKIKPTKEFARQTKLKIVSAGFCHEWCDESKPSDPFQFLSLMKNADYVITDTFHGTIFSILYKKRFGVFAQNKVKIEPLLKQFNLENRILDGKSNIASVMNREIDYSSVDSILADKRKESIEYLRSSLDGGR